jgi:hypothetical protein
MFRPPGPVAPILLALFGLSLGAAAARAQGAPMDTASAAPANGGPDDLGPTTAPPWNPPRAIPAAEPWETVVRLPGRIVSLPLSGLGWLTRNGMLRAEQQSLIPRALFVFAELPRAGIAILPASLGDRTGIGAKLGYRPPLPARPLTLLMEGSTRGYGVVQAALAGGPLSLGYRSEWRPQDRFYGTGLQSAHSSASDYAWQSQTARFALAVPVKLAGGSPRGQLSMWLEERALVTRRGHDSASPSTDVEFPRTRQRDRSFAQVVSGARAAVDLRGGAPHWTHGARAAFSAERIDADFTLGAFGPYHGSKPAQSANSFNRYTLDAEAGISFMRDPRTLRVRFKAVDTEPSPREGRVLPLPDLARLGGSEGLAGFEPHRFHDLDAMVVKLSYIFPLAKSFEFEAHAEAGGVYPDLQHDARLDTLKGSYGVALRPRSKAAPLGAIGVDWSAEALRIQYTLGGVE